jgi:aspartate/tyrosine/aromatic aminotransferase
MQVNRVSRIPRAVHFRDLAHPELPELRVGLDPDAAGVRALASEGGTVLVASSMSKNFGLVIRATPRAPWITRRRFPSR